jgi:hypothetical protein
MTWQKLKYGTLVAAGLAVSGTLWYDRTSDEKIYMRDVLEVYQGAKERWVAEGLYSGTILELSMTNTYFTWTNTSPHSYTAIDTNGTPYLEPYVERLTNEEFTAQGYDWAEGNPFLEDREQQEAEWGYFVFGGYTQYVASGFTDTTINTTYRHASRDAGHFVIGGDSSRLTITDIFTNDVNDHALCVYGPDREWCMTVTTNKSLWDSPASGILAKMYDEDAYEANNWRNSGGSEIAGDFVGSGVFQTNKIRGGLALTKPSESYRYSTSYYDEDDLTMPLDQITWATRRSMFAGIRGAIDIMLSDNDECVGWGETFDPEWLNRLNKDASGFYTNITETNSFTANALSYGEAFTNAGLSSGEFSEETPSVMERVDLTERNDLLYEMQDWGHRLIAYTAWTNSYYGTATSGVSWADAKTRAIADSYSNTTATLGAYTHGIHYPTAGAGETKWRAYVYLGPFLAQGETSTNLPVSQYDFYVATVPPLSASNVTHDTTLVYTNGGHSYYTGTEQYLTNNTSPSIPALKYLAVRNILDGVTPADVPWCSEPIASSNNVYLGFKVTNYSAYEADEGVMVTRFDFDHCTNSVP